MRRHPNSFAPVLVACMTVVLSHTSAHAAWRPRAWRPPVLADATQLGLRIAVDPVDRALSMPTDDPPTSEARVEREGAPLQTIFHADGMVQVVLDDRYMEYAVASKGENGRPIWTCVKGPSGIRQFLMQSAAAPAAAAAPVVQWEER